MTNLTSMIVGLEANGVESFFTVMEAEFYSNLFGITFNGRNSRDLAVALLAENVKAGIDKWNRHSISKILPHVDGNLLARFLGMRLW